MSNSEMSSQNSSPQKPVDPLATANDIAFIYVTFPTRQLALRLGREAVEKRLAACTNIFTEHDSIYRWDDKVEKTSECAAIFKTTAKAATELADFVRSQHPYDTPCITRLTPDQMNTSFASWIRASVS